MSGVYRKKCGSCDNFIYRKNFKKQIDISNILDILLIKTLFKLRQSF